MKALVFFAPLLLGRSKGFALALLLSLVTLLAGTALLGVSGWFLTATALTAAGISFNLFAPSAAVRGFSFIRILARYGEKLVGHNATLQLLSDLRRWLFSRLFPRLPLPGRSLRHGDLVSRMTADVDALDTLFLLAVGPLLAALVLGGLVTAVLMVLLPGAGWAYLSMLLAALFLVPGLLVAATRGLGRHLVETAATLRTHVLDAVAGHDDIVLFGQQAAMAARFDYSAAELAGLRRRQALATSLAAGAVQILTGATLLTVLITGLAALEADAIGGPVLAGLVLAVLGSFEATGAVVRSVGKFGAALASAERLMAVATLPEPIPEPLRPVALPEGNAVRFESVSFSHGGARILDDLSLDLAPGEHVAISGASGAGKSTLLALLLRLLEPQKGAVRIAGTDIRDVALDDLYARVVLLSQDSPVFLDTVRNNLLLARPEARDAELWAALRDARLEETVRALPKGLDTLLGETGTTLSAGQARRLCLARALLSPASIIALDEPTAGLDREAEEAFLIDLPAALRGRTAILVTHALMPEEAGLPVYELRGGALSKVRP